MAHDLEAAMLNAHHDSKEKTGFDGVPRIGWTMPLPEEWIQPARVAVTLFLLKTLGDTPDMRIELKDMLGMLGLLPDRTIKT